MADQSFVPVNPDSDFPLHNLPFGVYARPGAAGGGRCCVALGDAVVDLRELADAGLFNGSILSRSDCFSQGTLNAFMGMGRSAWREARATLGRLLSKQEGVLRDRPDLCRRALLPMSEVAMQLPAAVGDYTDFYASYHHAFNVGTMFRGAANAMQPNWLHLPVGYHGRASSLVPSGQGVVRPMGQLPSEGGPTFGPSAAVDFELEVAALMGPGNDLGAPIGADDTGGHIFGLVLMNDWSARDIQRWEYVPLGPFNGKNWATQVSPWVVTLDALEPYACDAPAQQPAPLPYLRQAGRAQWDLRLTVGIVPGCAGSGGAPRSEVTVTDSNLKHLYWTFPQMVAHHTAGGCNLRPGDLLGSGTVSGPEEGQRGCLLEITWNGTKPLQLGTAAVGSSSEAATSQPPSAAQAQAGGSSSGGSEARTWLLDGDEVVLRGWCGGGGTGRPRIGFGECRGRLLPARGPA